MKVRLLINRRGKESNEYRVFIGLYLKDLQERIYTGHQIRKKEWSEKENFTRSHTSPVAIDLKDKLQQINKAIKRIELRDEVATPLSVKTEFLKYLNQKLQTQIEQDTKAKANQKLLRHLVDAWVENELFRYQPATQKTVKESLNQFNDYLDKTGRAKLTKEGLTRELISDYERYLQEKKKLSNSTHGKRIKHLRWFLKTLSLDFDPSEIRIRNARREIIALSANELRTLEEYDCSSSSERQKAKDLFLLGCYTGLRISDLKRIDASLIRDGKLCFTLQKNKRQVNIPLVAPAKKILDAYGQKSPKLAEQVLNRTIKEVCRDAGIDQIETVLSTKGGKETYLKKYKWQLITSHASSKTFITTYAQQFDLSPSEIAAIVGKDLKTLINHYFKLPQESAIKKMENA